MEEGISDSDSVKDVQGLNKNEARKFTIPQTSSEERKCLLLTAF